MTGSGSGCRCYIQRFAAAAIAGAAFAKSAGTITGMNSMSAFNHRKSGSATAGIPDASSRNELWGLSEIRPLARRRGPDD